VSETTTQASVEATLEGREALPHLGDWTSPPNFLGNPTRALCGAELWGIPAPAYLPLCDECDRLDREPLS
jgi:hypothetical protein